MKRILLIVSVLVAACAVSCQKETKVEDAVTVKSDEQVLPAEGGVISIAINSTVAWTAKASESWVTLSPASGEAGDATVKASVLKNDTNDSRTATVTFTAGTKTATYTIVQSQLNALVIATTEYEVPAEGGTVEVKVSANVDYQVIIPDAVDWVENATTRGMTESTVVLKVAPSLDVEARTANITISDGTLSSTVKITQAPFEPYYDLLLPEGVGQFSGFGDGSPLVLGADVTSYTIEVSSNLEHHCYFAPWDPEAGAAVETNDVGWIKFEYDNDKIVFTLEPNTTYLPREEYFYSGCFVGDQDFAAYGSCVLIRQEGLIPEAGASVLWTKTLPEIGIPAAYNRLAYKTAGGDALLVSDGDKIHVVSPADGSYWKAIDWTNIQPTSICSDDAGNIVAAEDIPFAPETEYVIYYTDDVNKDPKPLIKHTADFDGTLGSVRVRGNLADRAVVTGFVTGNRYWAGWEIDKFEISMDNYYAQGTGGQARGPIAVDADAWNPESGAVMSLGARLNDGIVYRAYDTSWCLYYLADAYTPNWLTPYDWKNISDAGAGAGNENQNNMDIIDYNGRRIIAYTQGAWFTWGGNHDVYFLDVTNPLNTEVIAILSGDELAAVDEIPGEGGMASYPYADVKLHVEDGVGLVCYVVNSTYQSLSKVLLSF
jgi:hypothetical protein